MAKSKTPAATPPKPKRVQKIKHGKIDGLFWVWPDGKKTHLRFLNDAVTKFFALPVGFYDEVKKSDSVNLKNLVIIAKSRFLKCTVIKP